MKGTFSNKSVFDEHRRVPSPLVGLSSASNIARSLPNKAIVAGGIIGSTLEGNSQGSSALLFLPGEDRDDELVPFLGSQYSASCVTEVSFAEHRQQRFPSPFESHQEIQPSATRIPTRQTHPFFHSGHHDSSAIDQNAGECYITPWIGAWRQETRGGEQRPLVRDKAGDMFGDRSLCKCSRYWPCIGQTALSRVLTMTSAVVGIIVVFSVLFLANL